MPTVEEQGQQRHFRRATTSLSKGNYAPSVGLWPGPSPPRRHPYARFSASKQRRLAQLKPAARPVSGRWWVIGPPAPAGSQRPLGPHPAGRSSRPRPRVPVSNGLPCVQPGTDGNSSGPGKHMLNMTMVFEQPGFQCDNDPCSIQSEVLWTDVRSMHRTQPMSSTVANPQLYIFIDYIMLHEFGHTLGLPDFYADTTGLKNVVAIMNDSGAARNVKDEDIEQLRAIYILHTRH